VQRENGVAVWVGERKSKAPLLPQRARQKWGTRKLSAFDLLRSHRPAGETLAPHKKGMDITWLTDRIAVGGGIWNADNMHTVARAGITHIVDMQIEFDDTPLARPHGIEVLWNPTDDDFEMKPAGLFRRGVDFAEAALGSKDAKVFIHCAAGVHRAPMMALAILGSMGWELEEAMQLIESRRAVADFADVYVRSVEEFLGGKSSG
jgi:protein-tyrosine phosphatase